LDKELQAGQNGQTKGIPIGPATSLGIAELVLSNIDVQLDGHCDVQAGVRFIDDIELSFKTLAQAEDALPKLEGLLHEYDLQPNAGKTTVAAPMVIGVTGAIPPKLWNRLGTRLLPKLRGNTKLHVGNVFSAMVESGHAESLVDEVKRALDELGVQDKVEVRLDAK
jgi:hypothetical protein